MKLRSDELKERGYYTEALIKSCGFIDEEFYKNSPRLPDCNMKKESRGLQYILYFEEKAAKLRINARQFAFADNLRSLYEEHLPQDWNSASLLPEVHPIHLPPAC